MGSKLKHDKVLFFSRIDFLSPQFRQGLLNLLKEVAKQEQPNFAVLAGGLISYPRWMDLKKARTKEAEELYKQLREHEKEKGVPKQEREHTRSLGEVRGEAEDELLDKVAQQLAEVIPVLPGKDGKPIKIYITLSRTTNYDGPRKNPVGVYVAERLEHLREDIVFWERDENARFQLKNVSGNFVVLNPRKGVWRSKFYSRGMQRLIEDEKRSTTEASPSMYVAGTSGSAVVKPVGGENSEQEITVPVLHSLSDVQTAENQIGVVTADFVEDATNANIRTLDFKEAIQRERAFISPPAELEAVEQEDGGSKKSERDKRERQRAIFEEIRKDPCTIGQLEDRLPWRRQTLMRDIDDYNEQGFEPAIVCNQDSGYRYDIDHNWLQFKLRYRIPSLKKLNKDTILAFGCLHAGYRRIQDEWFVSRLPELIVNEGIDVLVGCGDYIAGRKHNLLERGEIHGSMPDYTHQERLAAKLTGKVIVQSFKAKFDNLLKRRKKKNLSDKELAKLVNQALIHFFFWRGNHDEWQQDDAHEPLSEFRNVLERYVTEGIHEHLEKRGFVLGREVSRIASEHLVYSSEHTLPSGVTMSIRHPHQGKTKAISQRAQETLEVTEGQFVAMANFHTSVAVHESLPETGQRLALQVPTITSGTDFEYNMNKIVDTGVGIARLYSHPENHRIHATDVMWDSPREDELSILYNEDLVREYEERVGV